MASEIFGSITKEEQLKTVTEGVIPNTFVMENQIPFPGYYGALPTDKVPDSFFLILVNKESTEKIMRITHIVKNNSNINFEGSPVKICVHNDTFYGVRIRGLKEFADLEELQHFYRDNGLEFMKKKNVNDLGIIRIKKIFNYETVKEGVYKDNDEEMYYLKIDKQITWSNFKAVTKKVKNNIENATFDAALSAMYGNEVYDFIRVYCKDMSMAHLDEIHEKYKEIVAKTI